MTIFRTEHKKNYTCINNFICKDKRLSYKAKGIWMYAFSRPDDWVFNEKDIMNNAQDGRDSIRAGLRELEDCGYLHREQSREKGKFSDVEWVFYETPQPKVEENPSTENPSTAFQSTENTAAENPTLLSTEFTPSIEASKQSTENNNKAVVVSKKDSICKSDIHCLGIAKGWKPEEIELAWSAFEKAKHPISSPIDYIEGIINNKRAVNQNKEQSCHKTQMGLKAIEDSEKLRMRKEEILANATSEPLLVKLLRQNGSNQKLMTS